MISDVLALSNILQQLESTLLIEYADDKSANNLTTEAIKRIENNYVIKISASIYELQTANALTGAAAESIINGVVECLKSLTLYTTVTMFQRSIPISMSSVNYLGMSRADLLTALRYLQDEKLYESRLKVIPSLKQNVSNIETNTIKRLFIILFVLDALGMPDGVACVAQLLYLICIVV